MITNNISEYLLNPYGQYEQYLFPYLEKVCTPKTCVIIDIYYMWFICLLWLLIGMEIGFHKEELRTFWKRLKGET